MVRPTGRQVIRNRWRFFAAVLALLLLIGGEASARSYAYIAHYGSNTVSMLDTATRKVVTTVRVGAGPGGVAVAPGGARVYVSNYNGASVSVVDTAANVVTATIPVGANPNDMAVLPGGSKVYVANAGGNSVSVIDAASLAVSKTISAGMGLFPVGAVAHPGGARVYVATRDSNSVSVIDTATDTVIGTIAVGAQPHHMAISPDGARIYVGSPWPSPSVSVIDTATDTVIATVTGPGSPVNAAVTPDNAKVYVPNREHGNVSVIDAATHVVIATIPVGAFPYGASVAPDGSRVYVTNANSGTISLIDPATDTVVETINLGAGSLPYTHGSFVTPSIDPPSGRVAWWRAENDATDAMGFNNGTAHGAGLGYADGRVGRAFSFDGSASYVQAADSPSLDLATHFTLEAWIYPTNFNGDKAILSKVGGGCGNNGYQMGLGGTGGSTTSAFCSFNSSGEVWATNSVGGGSVPANAWSHIACTYDHDTFTIYVNGIPVGSKPVGAKTVADSCSTVHISGDDNNHVWFSGLIDEAAIYNRSLSGREVAEAFGAVPTPFAFAARTGVQVLTAVESEAVALQGLTAPAAISVTGGEYAVSADGTAWGVWTSTAGTVSPGDRVRVRLISPASYAATAEAVLTVGGGEAAFRVTTETALPIPAEGLRLWLRADSGVTLNGSNQVSGWADISGNGFTVAQGTGAKQPLWVDGAVNGKPILRFDGGDDYLQTAAPVDLLNGAGDFTLFVAVKPASTQRSYADIVDYQHANYVNFAIQQNGGETNRFGGVGLAGVYLSANHYQILTNVCAGALATSAAMFVNGGRMAYNSGFAGSSFSTRYFTVGNKSVEEAPRQFNGDIAEVIVYNTPLADADRQAVEAYLLAKYGIDVTPEPFTFPDRTDAPLGAAVESDPVTVTGIQGAAPIAVTVGEYAVSTDGGNSWSAWTSAPGGAGVGDKVKVRLTSPASYASTAEAVLTVGGVAATFRVTTVATPSIPVSGLRLWLKADAGVTKSGTNQVSRWSDFSGTGFDVAQAASALQPTWVEGAFNGRPAIRFDGGDDYLETLSTVNLLGGTGQLTVMVVVQPGTAQQTYADILDYNHWDGVRFVLQQNGNQLNFFSGPGAPGQQLSSAAPQVVTYTFVNGGAGTSRFNGLNRQSGSGSSGSFAEPSWLTLGNKCNRTYPALSRHFRGDIAEVIVYNTVLADADLQAVETYLMGKYGIDLTPDAFSFAPVTGAALSTGYRAAETVTVSGLTYPAPVGITGGEYELNASGLWSASNATVGNGDTVRVRLTSPASFGTTATATLAIGAASASFNVTTKAVPTGVWTDFRAASFAGGDGSAGMPFLIATAEQLALLAFNAGSDPGWTAGRFFALTADINLASHQWVPIAEFRGAFNGRSHRIDNLTIDSGGADYQGLFGQITSGAVVSNIGLVNVSVVGRACTGSLAGSASSATVTGCYATGSVNGNNDNGGLIGCGSDLFLSRSWSSCSVTSRASLDAAHAGGLVGDAGGTTTISSCYATGPVIITGGQNSGGLIGLNYGGHLTVANSFSVGNVITDVTWWNNVSGFLGLAGPRSTTAITDSYSAGVIVIPGADSSGKTGGIVGGRDGGSWVSVANSYYNAADPPGQGGGTALSVAEMRASGFAATLNGAQSPAPWLADEDNRNGGFPLLAGLPTPYAFAAQTEVAPGATIVSNTLTLFDIPSSSAVSLSACTGAPCQYRINGGAWTDSGGTVSSGDSVTVRLTAAAASGATVKAVLAVDGVGYPFVVTTLPSCTSAPEGLVSWWRAEGDARDAAGAHHGNPVGGVAYAAGRTGQAFSFNGVDGYVDSTTPSLTGIPGTFTLAFWALPQGARTSTVESNSGVAGLEGQRYAVLPEWGGNSESGAGAGVSVGTNGISVVEHRPEYLPTVLVHDAVLSGWTHVAVVYENGTPRLYVNGAWVRTGNQSPYAVFPSKLFGTFSSLYGPYAGLLDEVLIYGRALADAEIAALYNAGGAGLCPGSGCAKRAGDVNYDRQITLADAILTLQIAVGPGPDAPGCAGAADVDGDGRIGPAEALFVLQALAGLRP
jgi:YVTN family beta-propeller protein